MSHEFFISELDRRLSHMITVGTIEKVDHKKARVRVKIGDILTAWRPWSTASKNVWQPPEIGDQVLFIAPSGDTTKGIAIPALYNGTAPSDDPNVICLNLKGGEIRYDGSSNKITASVASSKIEISDGKIELKAPIINLNGKVNLRGGIS